MLTLSAFRGRSHPSTPYKYTTPKNMRAGGQVLPRPTAGLERVPRAQLWARHADGARPGARVLAVEPQPGDNFVLIDVSLPTKLRCQLVGPALVLGAQTRSTTPHRLTPLKSHASTTGPRARRRRPHRVRAAGRPLAAAPLRRRAERGAAGAPRGVPRPPGSRGGRRSRCSRRRRRGVEAAQIHGGYGEESQSLLAFRTRRSVSGRSPTTNAGAEPGRDHPGFVLAANRKAVNLQPPVSLQDWGYDKSKQQR